MHRGYVKEWRKELDSQIWRMHPLYHRVWSWLKKAVNHTDKTFYTPKGEVSLQPGQKVTSLRQIAEGVSWEEWGVVKTPSPKTIKSILEWLQEQEMLTVESNAKGTLISLTNWSIYQHEEAEKVTQGKQSLPTNNNDKNEKNKKPIEQHDMLPMFERLWERYPRKAGKDAAWRHFKRTVRTPQDAARVWNAMSNYIDAVDGKDKQFIKHGSAWFNCWQDWEQEELW